MPASFSLAFIGETIRGEVGEDAPQIFLKFVDLGVLDGSPIGKRVDRIAKEIFGEQASLEGPAGCHFSAVAKIAVSVIGQMYSGAARMKERASAQRRVRWMTLAEHVVAGLRHRICQAPPTSGSAQSWSRVARGR